MENIEKDNQRDKIIEQLEMLNMRIEKQNSFKRVFVVGVVYGVGFFIGSAIIATIALGIFGPIVGKIDWVRTTFETGASLIKK